MNEHEQGVYQARKRGALLGYMTIMDWFITNDHADLAQIHETIKKAIREEEEDENKKHDHR